MEDFDTDILLPITGLISSSAILWILVALAAIFAWSRRNGAHIRGFQIACGHTWRILPRVPVAILAAGFIAAMLPDEITGIWLGTESGIVGIILASVVGAFVPSGPIVAFPVVIALDRAGAGMPQLIAFLTAWEVYALHRILIWELPLMSPGFVYRRLAGAAIVPPLAGIFSALITGAPLY